METTPKMTFAEAFQNVMKIPKIHSRARRSEFWYTTLICVILSTGFDSLGYWAYHKWGYSSDMRIIFDITGAYFLIENYASLCRRMHDIGKSCQLPELIQAASIASIVCLLVKGNAIADILCIVFAVIATALMVYALFLCTKDSDKGKNRYGYSDKYVDPNDNPSVINKFWEEYGNDLLKRNN